MRNTADLNIALLCNPLAGNGRAIAVGKEISSMLQSNGILFTLFNTDWPSQFDAFSDVWIIGGDGTLHYFINHYPLVQKPLSIFKGGSGNDFHWYLYKNMSLQLQVQHVLTAEARQVDAGDCNGILFINGCGIGFDGKVVKDLLGKHKKAGKLSYYMTIIKNIFNYREKEYDVQAGSKHYHAHCLMISIANGSRYGGGFMVAPKASVDDGLLDISLIRRMGWFSRLRYLPVMEKGNHLQLPFTTYFSASCVTVSCSESVAAHLDGEYLEAKWFAIKLLPGKFLFRY